MEENSIKTELNMTSVAKVGKTNGNEGIKGEPNETKCIKPVATFMCIPSFVYGFFFVHAHTKPLQKCDDLN